MKLKIVLIAGGLGLASLGAVGAFALSPDVRQGVEAGKAVVTLAGYRHGGHGGRRGGMMHKLCSDARGEHIEAGITFAETFMTFTPEQRTAWDGLTAAVRTGSEKIGETCEETKELRAERSLPSRLALAETASRTAAEVLGDVRPAFDGWYATLSDEQREALEGLMKRRGHKHRGKGRRG